VILSSLLTDKDPVPVHCQIWHQFVTNHYGDHRCQVRQFRGQPPLYGKFLQYCKQQSKNISVILKSTVLQKQIHHHEGGVTGYLTWTVKAAFLFYQRLWLEQKHRRRTNLYRKL